MLSEPHPTWTELLREEEAFLLTYKARGALALALEALAAEPGREVLVPAYVCPSVVQAIRRARLQPAFYPITESMEPDLGVLPALISSRTAAVVHVAYFGFPCNGQALLDVCAQAGVPVIEDCAHSFLNLEPLGLTGGGGAFTVYSFHKLLPSGGGGALRAREGRIEPGPLARVPLGALYRDMGEELRELLATLPGLVPAARLVRGLARRENEEAGSIRNPREAAPAAPETNYARWYPECEAHYRTRMPGWMWRLVRACDLEHVGRARRRNYQRWCELLKGNERVRPLLPELPPRVCPWAFPVLWEAPLVARNRLTSAGVPFFSTGETVHAEFAGTQDAPTPELEPANRLRERAVCLPVHQDLADEDIDWWAGIICEHE